MSPEVMCLSISLRSKFKFKFNYFFPLVADILCYVRFNINKKGFLVNYFGNILNLNAGA
jgi:hypothetical protein